MRFLLLFLLTASAALAQTDSVIVSGRVINLSARLYRQSPTVIVARTNLTRGGSEQAFPAPLQPDGQFRVAVPLVYPLEEMAFQVAGAATAFLAAAGQVSIEINADSLFVAAVPFRFGGVNAQVNGQFAQYKAAEYKQQQANRNERDRQVRRALNATTLAETNQLLQAAFTAPLTAFSAGRDVFPLVRDWVRAGAQYDAAAFVFDKAIGNGQAIPRDLLTQLLGGNDNLLTPARANALSRFGAYATAQIDQQNARGSQAVKIRTLVTLLETYAPDLTADDRERLAAMRETGAARQAELRYLTKLLDRRPDTLNRLVTYENTMQTARRLFDSSSVDYLKTYALTSVLPQAMLSTVQFFGQHIRPQLGNARLRQSFDGVVGQALRDTALVREARTLYAVQEKRTGTNYGPLGNGIFVTTGTYRTGDELLKSALDRNRGKVIYVVIWSPMQEAGRQQALDAQRLPDLFSSRDFSLLYVSLDDTDEALWLESVVRNRLRGDHVRFTPTQATDIIGSLNLYEDYPVRLITPQGKLYRREAALPDEVDKVATQIRELLR